MNESPPPVSTTPPTTGRFARWAATCSIIAPVVVLLIDFFVHLHIRDTGLVKRMVELFLAVCGLVFGITALATSKHGGKGILGKALAGICLNGLLGFLIIGAILLRLVLTHGPRATPQGKLDQAMNKLATAHTDEGKFYALDGAAKKSFEAGRIDEAGKYAKELLALAPDFQGNWNYGNAMQDGNLVLGRIALKEGRTAEAKEFLLKAGESPGSPQMNSFGPNMSLAKDLLEKGERETVLQYFELCRKFWRMDFGKLDQWSQEVKAGQIPNFGANLIY